MYKVLATCAAIAVTTFIMAPASAGAAEQRGDSMRSSSQIEVSSARRYRRYGTRRYYARPYYAPRPYYARPYYERPAYGYGYARGPSWGPAPFPFIFGLPN